MGRPTDEKKDRTVKLRISEEMYADIEGCGENISETIREMIRGGLEKHGKIQSGVNVPQKGENELKAALLLRCTKNAREIFEKCDWEGVTVISNAERESVPQNPLGMDGEHYGDLMRMCEISGMSVGRFMEYVYRLFSDGKIYIDGFVVKTRGSCDVRELEDICHRVNVDPQDMIDRLVKGLLRG